MRFKNFAVDYVLGVDPKSVVCIYFKQGLCQKGDRCKFSHDLAIERKAAKRNIYEDTREGDGMENWDDAKLEDVVNQKHGEDNIKKTNTTQIVCSQFFFVLFFFFLRKNNLERFFFFFSHRYANILSKQLRTKYTVGSGIVRMVKNVCISMLCRQVLH